MAAIFNKFKDILLGPDTADDEEYYEEDDYEEAAEPEPMPEKPLKRASSANNVATKIVNLHANVQMQVVIAYPKSVDDSSEICDYVKDNKIVIVNLEEIVHEECQRIVDFLGGVAYALNGGIQSVSKKIFILAPANVDISGQFKEELMKTTSGVIFPWVSSLRQ